MQPDVVPEQHCMWLILIPTIKEEKTSGFKNVAEIILI